MGVLYIESCCGCERPFRKCSCSTTEEIPGRLIPDPDTPRRGLIQELLRRLTQAESNILANSNRIREWEPIIEAIQIFLATQEGRLGVVEEFFANNVGEIVTVVATFDVIVGVVETIGTDVVVIIAPNDDIFTIPLTSIVSVAVGEGGGI
ncbi:MULTISPECIES: hypothetical protein [unclassified Sutcliffiella]|uniref:hypothetical protein n=1 Tax=unclassified Sutcliffiella TaxID=2837532 RepID=UPI0030D1E97D